MLDKVISVIFILYVLAYLITGYVIYYLCKLISDYRHEMAHALKARELHPELNVAIIVYVPMLFRMRKRFTINGVTVFTLNLRKRKRGQFQVSRCAVSDDFQSFSASEIREMADAGINESNTFVLRGLLVAVICFNVLTLLAFLIDDVCYFWIKLSSRMKIGKRTWSDFDVIESPEEFREYSLRATECGYTAMVKFAESFF